MGLTLFTDEEELTGGIGEQTPWLVASTLADRGAIVEGGAAWSSHMVRDGNLITGQNPQSSEAVAAAVGCETPRSRAASLREPDRRTVRNVRRCSRL